MAPETLMGDALSLYRDRVSIHKKGYQQEAFRLGLLAKSELGELAVRDVTSVHIARYRDHRLASLNAKTRKPLSPATVRLELSLLSNFFDICRIEWGLCEDNPVLKVRKPKTPPGRDRRLSPREDRQILRYATSYINPELLSIIVLALETAMRQSEILGMLWENVDLKSRVVHLPDTKNGTKRDVPLSVRAKDALPRLGIGRTGRVFTYSSNGLKAVWRAMTTRLSIENLHFHDLRHEATSRLFELGTLDMMEIAAITGHKSLSMLKRYTHLRARRLVRKLDGGKNKTRLAVLETLVPYPALVHLEDESVKVRLLDFDGITAEHQDRDVALRLAGERLMRHIIMSIRDGSTRIPEPDEYLDLVDDAKVVMIDPLAA